MKIKYGKKVTEKNKLEYQKDIYSNLYTYINVVMNKTFIHLKRHYKAT